MSAYYDSQYVHHIEKEDDAGGISDLDINTLCKITDAKYSDPRRYTVIRMQRTYAFKRLTIAQQNTKDTKRTGIMFDSDIRLVHCHSEHHDVKENRRPPKCGSSTAMEVTRC